MWLLLRPCVGLTCLYHVPLKVIIINFPYKTNLKLKRFKKEMADIEMKSAADAPKPADEEKKKVEEPPADKFYGKSLSL